MRYAAMPRDTPCRATPLLIRRASYASDALLCAACLHAANDSSGAAARHGAARGGEAGGIRQRAMSRYMQDAKGCAAQRRMKARRSVPALYA